MTRSDRPDRGPWVREAIARHERSLVAYAARIVGDLEQARDVVQETFLRLCDENPESVEPHLVEWLFTVCRNRALDVRRKERRVTPLTNGQAEAHASAELDPAGALALEESRSDLMRAMARLPEHQQEVLRLKFQHGLSYREISGATQLSTSNVGFLIHTGLKSLRSSLAAHRIEGLVS